MRKLIAGLALALASFAALAQFNIYTTKPIGTSAIGAGVAGGTAASVLFVGSTGLLAQDNTNFNYTTTSGPVLQVGSGSTTLNGWLIGYAGTSGYSGIVNNALTMTLGNIAFRQSTGGTSIVNAPTGQTVLLKIQDTTVLTVAAASITAAQPIYMATNTLSAGGIGGTLAFTNTAGAGPTIAAGTATTDVATLSVTRTNNNAAVATGVQFAFTDTTSAAGFLPFQVLGGAAASTNLFSLSKSGLGTFAGGINTVTAGVAATNGVVYVVASGETASGSSSYVKSTNASQVLTLGTSNADSLIISGGNTPITKLGGTTSSFPAIKRSSAAVNFRLADDSADTTITASGATFSALTTGTNADTLCLSAGGVVLIQAAACTISSLRFKENVSPYRSEAMTAINGLIPIAFTMKVGDKPNADWNYDKPQVGLAAENVAQVIPLAAIYEQDGVTPKSYRQEALIAVTIKAVQELEARVRDIEAANDGIMKVRKAGL